MTQLELHQALIRFAKGDMSKARKYNGILISQTKAGLVELLYNKETKTYSVISQDGGKFQKSGTAKEMEVIVAELYTIM